MPNTPNFTLPYPQSTDTPDVPRDIQALAQALDQLLVPAGTVTAYGAATAPSGWLLCDGSQVSRTTYARLFAVIGTTYGAGNGTTTFTLPNLRGRVVVMQDTGQTEFDTLGETGGDKAGVAAHTHGVGTYATASSGSHSHNLKQSTQVVYQDLGNNRTMADAFGTGSADFIESAGAHTHTLTGSSASSGTSAGNLQPYIVLNYIVKA